MDLPPHLLVPHYYTHQTLPKNKATFFSFVVIMYVWIVVEQMTDLLVSYTNVLERYSVTLK